MPKTATSKVTVPAVEAELDLSAVRQFGNGQDGRLIAIGYVHEPYYPHLSGPVLHFQLPDDRIVLTVPDPDGFRLVWKDNQELATVDEGTAEVVHLMWGQVNAAFQSNLLEAFGTAAVKALASALSTS